VAIPGEVQHYLEQLVTRLSWVLDELLIGVYVIGGVVFGEYRSESSDLDVYAIVQSPLEHDQKLAVAKCCSHRMLPCPARRLELVVISAQAARRPGAAPQWELNLNTGARQLEHVALDPGDEPSHWFVVDLAVAHQHGVALLGPPAHKLIGTPQAGDVRTAQAESVAWYAHNDLREDTVAAACRAWYWLETGRFASKREAWRWATRRMARSTSGHHRAAEH
jgi:hypothetical protein